MLLRWLPASSIREPELPEECDMAREPSIQSTNPADDPGSSYEPPAGEEAPRDEAEDRLRPTRLQAVIGQRHVVERMSVLLDAAKKRNEPLPHILLDGPPGLGKTTIATVLPRELGVDVVFANGPALTTPKEVMPYLTNLNQRSVLFIDEIHRLPRVVEEFLYPAIEDFRIDIVIGEGLGARTLSMPLKRFTLIGATTRSGLLSAPMRDRFPIREHLDYYDNNDLQEIITINARKLQMALDPTSAWEIARRSRGTPRIANSLLSWVRDYATSRSNGHVDLEITRKALAMQQIDELGLDRQDRRYLDTLVRVFHGGPTGVDALAATMNLSSDTLSEEVEPFLLRCELIVRTAKGRQATTKGFEHIGATPGSKGPMESQGSLF